MRSRISLQRSQGRLASLWFSGAGLLIALVLAQTVFGKYGSRWNEAWQWLMPTIAPTSGIIIGVLVKDMRQKRAGSLTVDRFVFRLTMILSAAYLSSVALTILLSPFAELHAGMNPLELMAASHSWLAPFQGLLTAAMGAFFVSRGD